MSIVRNNLMSKPFYKPYCGSNHCSGMNPRMVFSKDQFECAACGSRTSFEAEFIEEYKIKRTQLESSLSLEERNQLLRLSFF